ncbi:hypothetical protein [Marinobacter piscensis]|uniref:hypothetical protein n=1 Tax=Marinobacter piscensis TaxID=1562308 RepID=UPI00119F413B|nr:hypothetical protein [Marinobacter piscensis]
MRNLLIGTLFTLLSMSAQAQPFLAFSDLISGPSTGLGDGKGSGVIVTAWAQNTGSDSDRRKLTFVDSKGKAHEPTVYYWKLADGDLPSGPANLYASHKMREIAFSIPKAPKGPGYFYISVNGERSNSLPFNVRKGSIYHVKSNGSVNNAGSWSAPWPSVPHALKRAPKGSTLFIHDVDTGRFSNPKPRAIYWNNSEASGDLQSQFALVAYPGHQPKAIAQKAIENYRVTGMVVSKLDIYASNYQKVDTYGQPQGPVIETSPGDTFGVQTSKHGRVIANRIGDLPGGCASKWAGAISGAQERAHGVKIFGNEIYDYGCNGASKLHHTTYLSVRSKTNLIVDAWEWGYNYLHGNKAKFGIHNYDEGADCGDLKGVLKIHNNVITDQGGAGISVGASCNWSMDVVIENNVLINVGLAADWDGINPATSNGPEGGGISLRDNGSQGLTGSYFIRNNLIYRYSEDRNSSTRGCLNFQGSGDSISVIWDKNICFTHKDFAFVGHGYQAKNKLDNVIGQHNIWYYSGNNPVSAMAPAWDNSAITSDPGISIHNARISLTIGSPAFTTVSEAMSEVPSTTIKRQSRDVYGNLRLGSSSIGPLERAHNPPLQPGNLTVE